MGKNHYIIPIFVPHEGCPHNCVFCNQNSITGTQDKVDDIFVRNIIEQYLKTICNKNSIIEVSFFGGTFTAIPIDKQKSLLAVAKEYKDKGFINFIHLSTRPDYINDTILTNLKDYSVDIIELGVQSMDDEILKLSGRGHTSKDVIAASNLIKQYGFILGHQIMPGLPGDNFAKDIETTKKVVAMKPKICRIYPSLVIKNTPMELMYNNGTYKPYTLSEAVQISKVIYAMLVTSGINVIRVGLQPTEEINIGKELIAGPFHPAFRELVEGNIINELIRDNVPLNFNDVIIITLHPKNISKLYTDKKIFFYDTLKQLATKNVKVVANNKVQNDEILLTLKNKTIRLSIFDYMKRKYEEGYFKHL